MSSTILKQRAKFLDTHPPRQLLGWRGRTVCLVSATLASYLWANYRFTSEYYEKKIPSFTIESKENECEHPKGWISSPLLKPLQSDFTPSPHGLPPISQISKHLCNIGFSEYAVHGVLQEVEGDKEVNIDSLIQELLHREGNQIRNEWVPKRGILSLNEHTTKIEEREEKLFISTQVHADLAHTELPEPLDDMYSTLRYGVYTIGAFSSMLGVTFYNFVAKFARPVSASLMHGIATRTAHASLFGFVIAFPFLVYHHRMVVNLFERRGYDIELHAENKTDVIITTGPKEEEPQEETETNAQLVQAALLGGSVVTSLGYATGAVLGTFLWLF